MPADPAPPFPIYSLSNLPTVHSCPIGWGYGKDFATSTDAGAAVTGVAAFVLYGLAAMACALAAWASASARKTKRADRFAVLAALVLSAAWCVAIAALGSDPRVVQLLEIGRNIAWIIALFRHFANDGRHEILKVVRPVILTLALVEGLQLVLIAFVAGDLRVEVVALLRMLVAVGALVLVHNLYGGASDSSRRLLGWNSGAMALFWGFELNLFTIAYLTGEAVADMELLRALVMAVVAALVAIGAGQGTAGLAFRPSRAVTFSSLSLAVVAVYLLLMVGLAGGVARFSGDLARVTQVGLLLGAATVSLLWLPSPQLRARARVLALKHLFKHRYDYRAEWLRFTGTIGSSAGAEDTLHERAIQSLGDIADSPAGLLLLPDEEGGFAFAAHWQWPTAEVPVPAMPPDILRGIGKSRPVIDFDALRAGRMNPDNGLPQWLLADDRVWAGVPLLHGERLVGIVILARPQIARRLDWEDFDLLAIAGRQVASYLAEQAGQQALQDAARFEEFNRRMAFVMHDIKNLSSQLGLLARNAEKHAENPAFRADMLVTLRNSADKLDALVTRLGRYGRPGTEPVGDIDLGQLAQKLAARHGPRHRIEITRDRDCVVLGNAEQLEQALDHLIENAIEATPPDARIGIEVRNRGLSGDIVIADEGKGMSPQFIRHSLFRPFVSTKETGFGIGTCEARDLVRAMGGRLDVESREGAGSRFTIRLPSSGASQLMAVQAARMQSATSEKAA